MRVMSAPGRNSVDFDVRSHVRFPPIVLQKSKVVGLRIFRENTKREAIADLYNLNRVVKVAVSLTQGDEIFTSLHESRACSPQNF